MTAESVGTVRFERRWRILLVDDHPIAREGLAYLLGKERDFVVVGSVGATAEALASIEACSPDVVIVDIALGPASGLDLIRAIAGAFPRVKSIAFSMHDATIYEDRALRAGAVAYLSKTEGHNRIVQLIRRALADGGRAEGAAHSGLASNSIEQSLAACLTDHELQLIESMSQGIPTVQIESEMGVRAFQALCNQVMTKLCLLSLDDLVQLAYRWNSEHPTKPPGNERNPCMSPKPRGPTETS